MNEEQMKYVANLISQDIEKDKEIERLNKELETLNKLNDANYKSFIDANNIINYIWRIFNDGDFEDGCDCIKIYDYLVSLKEGK